MRLIRSWQSLLAGILVVAGLGFGVGTPVVAQNQGDSRAAAKDDKEPAPSIDAATGKVLNEAVELLNADNYPGAQQKISTLKMDRLSPYERSLVERILFQISYSQDKYDEARQHLQAAIEAGGLNAQEVSETRFQMAQLYMTQEKWKEGAAALEEWFKTAQNPNSASYYLLAVAYYQMDDYDRALPPAEKAVELMDKPQENWIGMLLALYLQREEYKNAIPILERLITIAPDKKTYWMQLSSVYGQVEDFPNALAIMQLAHAAGLLTEDSEYRRLADLLVFNEVPYRGAQILTAAIEQKAVQVDAKLYEKLANCWLAAGEYDKAVPHLQRAAEMADSGDLFVRLGEVQVQRQDWPGAENALQKGIDKGKLKDAGNAHLWMGIALYSQDKLVDARSWFQRASNSEKHRQTARGYLQAIEAKLRS